MPKKKKSKLKMLSPEDFQTFNFTEYQELRNAYAKAKTEGLATIKVKNAELPIETVQGVLQQLSVFYHQ